MADNVTGNSGGTTTAQTTGAVSAAAGMTSQQGIKQGSAGNDGVVIDKNKSKEQYIKDAEAKYIVPAIVRDKYPDLIKLIYETESMNEEEREYWLQIMPIMSEEQIVKFRDILVNEKEQLSKLDREYEQEMKKINKKAPAPELNEEKRKEEISKIQHAEKTNEAKEASDEDQLLKQLNNL